MVLLDFGSMKHPVFRFFLLNGVYRLIDVYLDFYYKSRNHFLVNLAKFEQHPSVFEALVNSAEFELLRPPVF